MKLDQICNKQDEFYTPEYAIEPILKYVESGKTAWCPFDTKESYFVKMLSKKGLDVINSHIQEGINFFNYPVPECDYIISNPPYSLKGEVFKRLFEIGKPFAMLVGVVGLFESEKRFSIFEKNQFEIMYLNRRVAYFKDYKEQKPSLNPPFSSVYLCSKMLPSQIVFERIKKA